MSLGYRDLNNVAGPFRTLLLEDFKEDWKTALGHWEAWHDMVLAQYSGQEKIVWNKRFESILCPTLIIWGKRDMVVPRRQAEDLHHNIKSSRLEG